LVNRF